MLDKFEDTYGNIKKIFESRIIKKKKKTDSHKIRTKQKVKEVGWGVSSHKMSGSRPEWEGDPHRFAIGLK